MFIFKILIFYLSWIFTGILILKTLIHIVFILITKFFDIPLNFAFKVNISFSPSPSPEANKG